MSKLAEYRQLEKSLAEQLKQLEEMKGDDGLKQEIEFESKLKTLLSEYDKSLRDVIAILDPHRASKSAPAVSTAKVTRKARQVKVYKNPHSGEVIETKGGNHRTLKDWKTEYGNDVVEGWASIKG
ncbi:MULTISPECIES: histone-like nucleoid-structuring protein, MvaT/MvaU family [Pseudomonas]|jgi:type IV pilus biogenesis protein CpaD/CtpE|uniref:histone-like nucleoid-structuring protein, MvaT/MvaU family n=1 Tax=Pseudomonas TaxID=286 RepID=UPI0018E7909E|nr:MULTISPECIES: histone-like nucleoid-structuring protein, MvaT/MvaU family [Pseudomonas]MBJ2215804.1 DNA binding protein [Pseudomonas carnis]MBP5948069.1 DNA binding protein [Pseudomonas sp. P9(2020)]